MSILTNTATNETIVTRTNVTDGLYVDDVRIDRMRPALNAGIASSLFLMGCLTLTQDANTFFSVGTLVGAILSGVIGYGVGVVESMKNSGLAQAKRFQGTVYRQDQVAKEVKKACRFPFGRTVTLWSGHTVHGKRPYSSNKGKSTHFQKDEIVFTPVGAYICSTITPNANKVWDDALNAVVKANGLREV